MTHNYYYLEWLGKRPNVSFQSSPSDSNFIAEVRIRGFPDTVDKIVICGNIKGTPHVHEKCPYKGKSYLLSHLQKSIRKMKPMLALKSAKHLLDLDPSTLLRRIPILMFEDVIPHKDLPVIVWLMMAVRKGFVLTQEIREWLLGVIYFLATNENHEPYEKYNVVRDSILSDIHVNAGNHDSTFLRSILIRISYGGMKGDMGMLRYSVASWHQKLLRGDVPDESKIRCIRESSLTTLTLDEWDLCANDFHCNHRLLPDLHTHFPMFSESYLKKLLWLYSSAPNKRCLVEKARISYDEYRDWCIIKKYTRWLQRGMLRDI